MDLRSKTIRDCLGYLKPTPTLWTNPIFPSAKHFLFAQETGDEASKCPDACWLKAFGERQINQLGFKAVTVKLNINISVQLRYILMFWANKANADVQTDFRTHQKLTFFLVLPSNVCSSGLLRPNACMDKRCIFATVVGQVVVNTLALFLANCPLFPSAPSFRTCKEL